MAANDTALHLREYWYIAATSSSLRRRPLARTVLGERLALLRREDGTPAAVIDRCAHRNTALSTGTVRDGYIECPYHGWRYDSQGTCVEIPSLRCGAAPAAQVRIRALPTCEQDGFIWVYPGEKEPVGTPRRFPHYGESGWSTFLMKTDFSASVIACLENFLDCPHTAYVHQGWFRSRNAKEVRARIVRGADRVEVEFFEERDAESVVSRLLFPSQGQMRHTDRFLMPTTTRVDYSFGPDRHFIITSQCTPISEFETEVYTVMTFRFGKISPLVRLAFEPLSRKVIRQDVDILRNQTRQLRHYGRADFTFVETDLVAPHIWKLWQFALKSPGVLPSLEDECHEVVLQF